MQQTRALPALAGHDDVAASGINELGYVVGYSMLADHSVPQSAVVWVPHPDGTMVPNGLAPLPGNPHTWAQDINNTGQIVGRSGSRAWGGNPRAVIWFTEPDGTVSAPVDLTYDSDDSGDNAG